MLLAIAACQPAQTGAPVAADRTGAAAAPLEVPPGQELAAPQGLSATPGDGEVVVRWDPVPGATAYNVYWSTRQGFSKSFGNRIAGVASPYRHRGTMPGVPYYYVVTAVRGGVESPVSGEARALPFDASPPGTVMAFAAEPGEGQVALTWGVPPDRDYAGVVIRRSTSGYPASPTDGEAVTDTRGTSFTDRGLNNGTVYYYAAFAHDGVPNYAPAARVEATPGDHAPPGAVTALAAVPADGRVVLSWLNPPDPDYAGVVIRRATGGYPASPSDGEAVADTRETSFTDRGLNNGTVYYYTAFAHDGVPNYAPGTQITATPADRTPPGTVGSFTVKAAKGQATLSWSDPPDPDYAGVTIRRSTSGYPASPSDGEAVADTRETNVTDRGLSDGTVYYYAAFAHDGVPNYAPAALASITPGDTVPPGSVTGFIARRRKDSVALSWNAPSDPDLAGVLVRRREDGLFPSGPKDGALVQDAPPGVTSFVDRAVSSARTYYYAAFAYDGVRNYAPPARAFDTPSPPFTFQEARLEPSDGGIGSRFGLRVAIGGEIAVVGAPSGQGGGATGGAVYVFRRRSGVWQQEARLVDPEAAAGRVFGSAVALSGERLLVGAPAEGGARAPGVTGERSGTAYLFQHVGDAWLLAARLIPLGAERSERFGAAVALEGGWALVGNPAEQPGEAQGGAVYAYQLDAGRWIQRARLTSSVAAAGNWFGFALALSGGEALVGAPLGIQGQVQSGLAFLFRLTATGWEEQARLYPSDGVNGDDFGFSVALQGDRALVGALFHDGKGRDAGAAYLFRGDGGAWRQEAKLTATDARAGDGFGYSVALRGDLALVGAYPVGSDGGTPGGAYLFQRTQGGWSQQARLTPEDARPGDGLGSVALGDEWAILGASSKDLGGLPIGAAYIFD
jgi:hypothetical protein